MQVKSGEGAIPLLLMAAAFVAALAVARVYRFRGGPWVPGWTGGIGLLVLFFVFFGLMLALGAPAWLEPAFFVVVGLHVGAYISLARPTLPGAWWQFWL